MQVGIVSNVFIRKVNQSSGECIEKSMHNLVTRRMIVGLLQYLEGAFVDGDAETQKSYIPLYLECGSNDSQPSFDMSALVTPFIGVSRVMRQSKELMVNSESRYGKIGFRFYMDSNYLKPTTSEYTVIKELGMFSTQNGNTMVSRVVLDEPLEKGEDDFIDVLWEITLQAVGIEENESEGN